MRSTLMSDHTLNNMCYERSQYLLWWIMRFPVVQFLSRSNGSLYCLCLLKLITQNPKNWPKKPLWAVVCIDGSTLYSCFLLIIKYQEFIKLIKKHPLWALIKSFMSDHTMKNISYDRSQYLLWPLIRFSFFLISFQKGWESPFTAVFY